MTSTTKKMMTTSVNTTSSAAKTSSSPKASSTTLRIASTVKSSTSSTKHTSATSKTSSTSTNKPKTTSATTAAASAVATTYEQLVLAHHNVHRANHSATDVIWSANLAAIALSIAETCVYEHNTTAGGGGYGQNIAAGVEASGIGEVISDLFYNGEVNYFVGLYGEASPDMTNFEHWGHFSQIVWKATTTVGCATYDCSSSGLANVGSDVSPYFTVCNYEGPGNVGGEYGANIGSPLDYATVTGEETVYT
ncbi:hypothetical protein BT93_L0395 [Corymbia citriodora subsp. variegata]|uniref:SCP domain-containing protein n=1 Tax=Corymbia citriodora subsp. variegata TaxID=360336 RepID=A0A8T0CET1_CORYI|nr:hypothetical protein BT93_L0395 [Corymbia citriodora subsp. variegata]